MPDAYRTFRRGSCVLAFGIVPAFSLACSASADATPAPGGFGDGGGTSTGAMSGVSGSSGTTSPGGVTGSGGDTGSSGGGVVFMPSGGTGSGGTSGASNGGSGACGPAPDQPVKEICGNGLDENLNGFVDENCSCTGGATQPCFNGPPSQADASNCHKGIQTCSGPAEFQAWGPCENSGCDAVTKQEVCNNGTDDNCDGRTDEGCSFDLTVTINGDCIGIPCPPQAPNPVGCDIVMEGGDSRGCVAHAAGNSAVYFKEGNACPFLGIGDAGHISGTLKCSTSTAPITLGPDNCKINKPDPTYTDNPGGCAQ